MKPIQRREQETALVIDHYLKQFHVSSSRPGMMSHLRALASEHNLSVEDDGETVSLSNVPVKLLPKLHLASKAGR